MKLMTARKDGNFTNLNDKQMKKEDFDRLKAVCEKEGFDIGFKYDESTYTVRLKKDIWEGVEFVELSKEGHNDECFTDGRVYKLDAINGKMLNVSSDNEGDQNGWLKEYFKPSTESAYIEQLKAEAFKRFGEIKEGDRFDRGWFESRLKVNYIGRYQSLLGKDFNYTKSNDCLTFDGIIIYQQGKWATRVKERVKVEPNIRSINDFADKLPENQKQELKEIIASTNSITTMKDQYGGLGVCTDDTGSVTNGWHISNFKPSTELAYIKQLKAEAFKRFGEIKKGQKFKRDFDISIDEICTIGECKNTLEFKYFKFNDSLEFCGSIVYQQGKWATRVKERVKVEPNIRSINDFADKLPENQKQELKEIIASKLEEYLNKD